MSSLIRTWLLLAISIPFARAADHYGSFEELARHERAGVDYRIRSFDRKAPSTILAIHGGGIETMTSEVTQAIARESFNAYLFEGLKASSIDNWNLHITSENFNEPCAMALIGQSRVCVSIHAFRDFDTPRVCLGGMNERLRGMIYKNLQATGLIQQQVQNPCGKYWGTSSRNFVNKCAERGVQIEMSVRLLDQLRAHPPSLRAFSSSVHKAIGDYLR